MRSSANRIVLAALAVIVGVVLALPMLLSRKAEAGEAIPLALDGDGGGKVWLRSRLPETQRRERDDGTPDAPAEDLTADQTLVCASAPSGDADGVDRQPCGAAFSAGWANGDLPVSSRLDALAGPFAADLGWRAQAHVAAALPVPLILVAKRRYHLRP